MWKPLNFSPIAYIFTVLPIIEVPLVWESWMAQYILYFFHRRCKRKCLLFLCWNVTCNAERKKHDHWKKDNIMSLFKKGLVLLNTISFKFGVNVFLIQYNVIMFCTCRLLWNDFFPFVVPVYFSQLISIRLYFTSLSYS